MHKAQFPQPDEDGEAPPESFSGLMRYDTPMAPRRVDYYLCGEILGPHLYTDLFFTLRSANPDDAIFLHLNTQGGDFDCGLQIVNNMLASPARVVTVLEARAYSMGALIFLAGDELVVHDNCQLMFHTYSGSFAGKGHEQQAQAQALASWFEKVLTRLCSPFLSAAEIGRVLKGSDLWMDSDEIRRRLGRVSRAAQQGQPAARRRAADEHD